MPRKNKNEHKLFKPQHKIFSLPKTTRIIAQLENRQQHFDLTHQSDDMGKNNTINVSSALSGYTNMNPENLKTLGKILIDVANEAKKLIKTKKQKHDN